MVSAGSDGASELGGPDAEHDGFAGGAISGNVESSDAACDGDVSKPHGGASQRRAERRADVTPNGEDDFHLRNVTMKTGVKQMISQAWSKHRRQQLAVSLNKNQLREIFMSEWNKEMVGFMNEVFTMELHLTPFVTEVYTD